MSTSWSDPAVCKGFDDYNDLPEQVLGYSTVFKVLRLDRPEPRVLLDYGCGPGKVSERVARTYGHRMIAVDNSRPMLEIARSRRPHPLVDYRQIEDSLVGKVEDASVDGAMTCYVFINIPSEARIRNIIQEVYRVLKPGAAYAILDTNPDTTGIPFSTFRNGEPGRKYGYGEPREVFLSVPGSPDLVLRDTHWPKEMYLNALRDAGFQSVEVFEPTLSQLTPQEIQPFDASGVGKWHNEQTTPPFVIFRAIK
ncbi:class I SAM-dependent methyltransferase [Stigmatella aurantiaca]|uniref:S-adenosylmethionine (SAM)-dependent methyltransferase n=1 Tax=Stigmatella aurantiaca (strain DW4/3-1) TaxID=378806 RepID=Q08W49_STIAD|nr:class I SAM-dependent methyltransferase [Stigmatella aurantiaca]ADO73560.1 S-adenosylmethionine (SAM)-dependent methyltransferase [Stigmatella aurantiaca DW4/3-1]EAU64715.1 S-adenosylmethionine (SAM)-dependent methyltransferase [Stigmatella aurantiaca DW4/3-1]